MMQNTVVARQMICALVVFAQFTPLPSLAASKGAASAPSYCCFRPHPTNRFALEYQVTDYFGVLSEGNICRVTTELPSTFDWSKEQQVTQFGQTIAEKCDKDDHIVVDTHGAHNNVVEAISKHLNQVWTVRKLILLACGQLDTDHDQVVSGDRAVLPDGNGSYVKIASDDLYNIRNCLDVLWRSKLAFGAGDRTTSVSLRTERSHEQHLTSLSSATNAAQVPSSRCDSFPTTNSPSASKTAPTSQAVGATSTNARQHDIAINQSSSTVQAYYRERIDLGEIQACYNEQKLDELISGDQNDSYFVSDHCWQAIVVESMRTRKETTFQKHLKLLGEQQVLASQLSSINSPTEKAKLRKHLKKAQQRLKGLTRSWINENPDVDIAADGLCIEEMIRTGALTAWQAAMNSRLHERAELMFPVIQSPYSKSDK